MQKLMGIVLCLALASPVYGAAPDSVEVWVGEMRADRFGASFLFGSEIYVPASEISLALGAECVVFNEYTGNMEVYADSLRVSAKVGERYITANGRLVYCPSGVIFRCNRVMMPASSIAKAFGAGLRYDDEARKLTISAAGEPIQPADWTEDDLYWLSRIVNAEARGESFEGKIAVANVVLNRVKSDEFPDSVKKVVFDTRFGVQFTPISDGSVYLTPSEESCLAARLALDGADVAGDSLYFASEEASKCCWAERNRTRFRKVDHQVFYL
ncbi:MAG: cell wall hydrolase [Oscillospiraceae bacterium]|nr:cell wall hydrolase [Oscillospiraceae bacterium]